MSDVIEHTPTDPPAAARWKWAIPEALSDEDGQVWFIEGHVEPALAVLAVVMEQVSNQCEPIAVLAGGEQYILRPDGGAITYRHGWEEQRDHADALLRSVEHVWAYPIDEERWEKVPAGTAGAEPWTWVTCRG